MALRGSLLVFALMTAPLAAEEAAWKPPQGVHDMPVEAPADNAITAGKIRLGEQLFFDKRLSKTKAMSCETCHVPEKGWTDGLALSPKFDGSLNTRHTPTLYGVAYYPDLYWDGRAKGLEAQILAAWKGQMGADPEQVAKELEAIPGYKSAFEAELGGPPTGDRIVKALATFVRTIHAAPTPWDRMSAQERDRNAGFKVFSEKARCTLCHLPPLFSDTLFHNVGIGYDKEKPDLGRGKHLADAAQKAGQTAPAEAQSLEGAFKTPTLRGAELSGPYFHDGRAGSLAEAVDLMLKGGIPNPRLDEKLKPATLTAMERSALLAFLESLTPEKRPYPRPKLP
ncbi:MAG TPA: cytochrome c peroxidase [Vicinamibacteria bacterium]|nr:cytochrome c peroxidase [Vicinamibacteria bacterium]